MPVCAGGCERADVYHRAPVPVFRSGRVNLQSNNYWSGTTYAPNASNAWNFNFNNGNQNNNNKTNAFYAWAVSPGG